MPLTKNLAQWRNKAVAAERARVIAEFDTLWNQLRGAQTFAEQVTANEALLTLLKSIVDSDHLCLWSFFDEFFGATRRGSPTAPAPAPGAFGAGAAADWEDPVATKALFAQLVAPSLAGRPPRWVRKRT